MRIFEKPAGEAFLVGRILVAENAREQADASLNECHGRDLPARENEIADGYFFQIPRFDHPLIKSLETAAEKQHARGFAQCAHPFVAERDSPG